MQPKTDHVKKAAIAVDIDGTKLAAKFANGQILVIDATGLKPELREAAMMHGLKQKLVDAAAISRHPTTGRPASVDMKFAAVKAVYDRLVSGGPWNAVRTGDGEPRGGLLFMALCRMYEGKKTPDSIRDFMAGLSREEQAALRRNPKVAAIIETIRAEQVDADGVDSDELLAGLDS